MVMGKLLFKIMKNLLLSHLRSVVSEFMKDNEKNCFLRKEDNSLVVRLFIIFHLFKQNLKILCKVESLVKIIHFKRNSRSFCFIRFTLLRYLFTLFLLNLLNSFINDLELIIPVCCVHDWPHVESVVITSLWIVVERWSDDCHFVSIDSIKFEKSFDFIS